MRRPQRKAVTRKPVRAVHRPKVAKRAQSSPGQAIVMRVPAPIQAKPWLLSQEEVTILKNSICKGASDEELKYCLAVARRYELDPFQQQIWFVPRWDSEAERSDGKKGAKLYVPVVGINGMLHIAARDHADFGTYSEPEYGPMQTITWSDQYGKSGKFEAPEWCKIHCFKKGESRPTTAVVWWNEIYPDVSRAPLVRRMPRLMLAKCAKAQATRTSYPKTGGLLIPEETQTREFTDITPGGRIITENPEPQNPHLQKFLDREKEELSKLTPPQKEVLAAKMIPCLFYRFHKHSDTYEIFGSDELKSANKDLLGPLWNGAAKAIVATPEQLGKLISQFEQRKVIFREQGA